MGVNYEVYGEEGLELIEPLWLQLRQMHRVESTHFKSTLGMKTFKERMDEILMKSSDGLLRVEIVKDEDGQSVAYCVSSINGALIGEVDSIFVSVSYRRTGIGSRLMEDSMRWMDGLGVKRRMISTIVGNEGVQGFYAHFGFLPRSVILERTPAAGNDR